MLFVGQTNSTPDINEALGTREIPLPKLSKQPLVACPRCEALLSVNYEEPACLQCGFVDYAYTPSLVGRKKKSIVSNGTHYVLRYVGDFPSLSNTLTHVNLRRLRNRVVYGVTCPFCGQEMEQSSLSGKRREVREERYKCEEGHRVSLTPNKNGSLGWK